MRPLPSSISVAVLVLVVAPSSDAAALNIALQTDTGSCYTQAGVVLPTVQNLLTARCHTVTIVDGSGLGTGRAVSLGPDYLANFSGYANEALVDWSLDYCAAQGLAGDQPCTRLVQSLQEHCEKQSKDRAP